VLQVLSDPRHPDLRATLRVAAAAITGQDCGNLALWLQGGLVTHLTGILEALPTLELAPAAAANTCAAAASTLCNIIHHASKNAARLPPSISLEVLLAQAGCEKVLEAVVVFGMKPPAASEPLPPGCSVHVKGVPAHMPSDTLTASTAFRCSEGFWTPLRVCGYFLEAMLGAAAADGGICHCQGLGSRIEAAVAPLLDPRIFSHLLEAALEDPGGKLAVL
jgi:hypothetical protein